MTSASAQGPKQMNGMPDQAPRAVQVGDESTRPARTPTTASERNQGAAANAAVVKSSDGKRRGTRRAMRNHIRPAAKNEITSTRAKYPPVRADDNDTRPPAR